VPEIVTLTSLVDAQRRYLAELAHRNHVDTDERGVEGFLQSKNYDEVLGVATRVHVDAIGEPPALDLTTYVAITFSAADRLAWRGALPPEAPTDLDYFYSVYRDPRKPGGRYMDFARRMLEAERALGAPGLWCIIAETPRGNPRSVAIHEDLGFRRVGTDREPARGKTWGIYELRF
jgi:hypothetical protein